MTKWSRPPAGVFKINVAGYADESRMFSTIGCVMRNITGYMVGGYYGKMAYVSNLIADIHSIYYGIKLAHDEGIKHVEIECNSQLAVDKVLYPDVSFERSDIIDQIRDMMERSFESFVLRPVLDSSNQLAIAVCYYSIEEGGSIRHLNSCPSELIGIMAADWLDSY